MMNRSNRNRIQAALVVLSLLLPVLDARAVDLSKPVMLVASPSLQGGYSETVLVAVPRGSVHVGFILNRTTNVTLASVLPSYAGSAKVVDPVYFGGPEMSQALFAVVNRNPGSDAWQLFGDLHVASTAGAIGRIIEQSPNDARYFAGFVGWPPGELEKEVAAGFWYVTDPDPSLLRSDASHAWESLVKKLGNGHAVPRGMVSASLTRE